MPYTKISADIAGLFEEVPATFLSADVASAASSISVDSIHNVDTNDILFCGEPGQEKSEIVLVHASTAPTGSTVTLASALTFDHSLGEKLYILPYNQVEFSWCATTTGVKTVLATQAIDADELQTTYSDASQTSGYYFIRFKNSINGVFSDYSDPIPYAGWAHNQVGYMMQYALKRNGLGSFTESITRDFLIDEADACLQFMNNKLRKWESLQDFDHIIDQTTEGNYSYPLPSTVWQYSPKSILGVRIASQPNMTGKDKVEFDALMEGIDHTTLVSNALVGATSVTVTNAYDLDDAGTAMCRGVSFTYTAKNTTTGVLSGIPASGSGSITSALTAGDDIWQNASEGEPDKFTVVNGNLLLWPPPSASWANKNLVVDFWTDAPSVDSEADTIDKPRSEAVKHWLTWVVRSEVKNHGERNAQDTDYLQFSQILQDSIMHELKSRGQKNAWQYKTNRMLD